MKISKSGFGTVAVLCGLFFGVALAHAQEAQAPAAGGDVVQAVTLNSADVKDDKAMGTDSQALKDTDAAVDQVKVEAPVPSDNGASPDNGQAK